jgi:hypothetical protein
VWFQGPWTGNRDQHHPTRYIPLVGITARSHLTPDPLDPPRKFHHAALREALGAGAHVSFRHIPDSRSATFSIRGQGSPSRTPAHGRVSPVTLRERTSGQCARPLS